MTLSELVESLPNGLHDCEVAELSLAYTDRTIRLKVNVWVGCSEASSEKREEYRPGLIELRNFEYCILDRPDPNYPYKTTHKLTVDVAEPDPCIDLDGGGSACRLWVGQWNAFIHIRAGDATLTWTGPSAFRISRPKITCTPTRSGSGCEQDSLEIVPAPVWAGRRAAR